MQELPEKRAARRISRSIYVKYRLATGRSWSESESLDVSVSGIRLKGSLLTRKDDLLELRFCIKGNLLNCKMQVTHASKEVAGGYFLGLNHGQKTYLRDLIYS